MSPKSKGIIMVVLGLFFLGAILNAIPSQILIIISAGAYGVGGIIFFAFVGWLDYRLIKKGWGLWKQ